VVKEQEKIMIERGKCGRHPGPFDPKIYSALQKGGDPAAGSPTATLLRLRPSHRVHLRRLRPCGSPTGFGCPRLPWRDGRCVQGPGTYSPRRSLSAFTSDSGFMHARCRLKSVIMHAFSVWLSLAW